MNAAMEMPKYQSHKKVWALKIAAIEFAQDGSAKIAPEDSRYAIIETKPDYRTKFHGVGEGDLGYYVVYADGYASWSPTKDSLNVSDRDAALGVWHAMIDAALQEEKRR